ncbi:YebC/PmpR family DNA-binding transcriptional regulator [Vallitalea sp.]|jgi:YebC/PmpR family DNA-binding regulatory protein|uniref:YebC/PmpR family DNA-binding transcriptional regulator n=1 Tax=Vallitalea sp. TaxID=1882829 RepID=UPI0025EF95DA|nr:YebC/PmpR family DNA-binding transcriptional regulator [Vallitalea sp.]MCT4687328.1 YebC/PmpR family DNA-binding transcriptional regulator [Vallitalea sp.]
MSGHSKFANIKHRKERQDAKKGKVFTKIGREIAVAVKEGGSDPSLNSKLRDVVAKAKANNMPNDTISRSIKKASGELGNINYEHIIYEGYGPSGVAVIVDCLTENKNRTAANIRHAFSKNSGNLGTTGCVSFMFDKKGQIIIERTEDIDEDELMMIALDSGAEDFVAGIDFYEIITTPEDFGAVNTAVDEALIQSVSAEITMLPQTTTKLTSEDDIMKMEGLIDQLEEDDDVQNVWHNFDEN